MSPGDAHVHTQWSWDAPHGSMEQACARAVALGLPTIAFTDHADFVPLHVSDGVAAFLEDLGATVIDGVFTPAPFDIDGYLECIERCRAQFADLEIQSAVELGEPHLYQAEAATLLDAGRFDLVVAAEHSLAGVDGGRVEVSDAYLDRPPPDVVHDYLAEIERLIAGWDRAPPRPWVGQVSDEALPRERYRWCGPVSRASARRHAPDDVDRPHILRSGVLRAPRCGRLRSKLMSDERKRLFRFWPDGYQALHRLSDLVKGSGLEESLLELVKMRASQINGCAYCIDMHSKDARAAGETEQRLYALNAWRETPFFTERECAALALTEAVTLVAGAHVPGTVLEQAATHFTPEELSKLLYAIIEINAWNRLAITVGAPEPGSYRHSDSQ